MFSKVIKMQFAHFNLWSSVRYTFSGKMLGKQHFNNEISFTNEMTGKTKIKFWLFGRGRLLLTIKEQGLKLQQFDILHNLRGK